MKRIRKILLPMMACVCLASAARAQDFDVKALDKLGANATSMANVTLNAAMLRLGAAFLGNDGDTESEGLKAMLGKLKGVYIRVYKFDKPGQYSDSDLAPIRAMLSAPKWTAVVDVRERQQSTQICFLMSASSDKLGGVAVVTAEPRKVTVIYIDGEMDPSDIAKLSGNLGIPEIHDLDRIKKDDNKNRK
jgi:hypothetical protein